MKCPYCAEEIQDDAVICRYCFAEKLNGRWQRSPNQIPSKPQAHTARFTIRIAGAFFIASTVVELFSISSTVQLFGSTMSGIAALVYHLVFMTAFFGMGWGLWSAKPWGFQMMVTGTVLYTLDRLQYLLTGSAVASELDQYGALIGNDGLGLVSTITAGVTLMILASWWGFLVYLYFKRDYFSSAQNLN